MNTCPDASEAEAAELVRMMKEACSGSPVMTPEGAGIMLSVLIKELGKIAQQSEEAGNVKQEWGRIGQVSKIYGYTTTRMDDFLIPWVAAGKVRVITPTDPLKGTHTYKLYNLADVADCMEAKS